MAGTDFGGRPLGAGRDQKAHLDAGDGRGHLGCRLGGAFAFVFREPLGSGDDEERTAGSDFLIQGEGGFLGGVGLVGDYFLDLADDQILGDLFGGKTKDGRFGVKGGIGWQVDDIGAAAFIDVVALNPGFQGNG